MSKTLIEKINESIAVIEGLDKENLELGKHVVNEDFFYLVSALFSDSHPEGPEVYWHAPLLHTWVYHG